MKKIFVLTIATLAFLVSFADSQKGYVRTKGRRASNGTIIQGQRLADVSIEVDGKGTFLSKDKGIFVLNVPRVFKLSRIQKKGYSLHDPADILKTHTCNPEDLVIVLDVPSQNAEDKLAIQEKRYRQLDAKYKKLAAELNEQKERNAIDRQQYREEMQRLFLEQEEEERLVEDLAERYSQIDFEALDEFELKFSNYLLDGEIEKADSLLKTKGNVNEAIARLEALNKRVDREKDELAKLQASLSTDTMYQAKMKDELGLLLYHHFEIFSLRNLPDSAAYYIELRAGLDPENVRWQLDAGDYIRDYVSDFEKAGKYYNDALQSALAKDPQSDDSASCYNRLALLYHDIGENEKALECSIKASEIWRNLNGEIDLDVAVGYLQLYDAYYDVDRYEEAMGALEKSIEIIRHPDINDTKYLATAYNRMGNLYETYGDYDLALEYYNKVKELNKGEDLESKYALTTNLEDIAHTLRLKGEYQKAIDTFNEVIGARNEILMPGHPAFAADYNGIGGVYYSMRKFDTALEYFNKALDLRKEYYPENHPLVLAVLGNIGSCQRDKGNPEEAVETHKEMIRLLGEAGEGNAHLLESNYVQLGVDYHALGDYDKAIECMRHGIEIVSSILDENHPKLAYEYNNIGYISRSKGDFEGAFTNFEKALSILTANFPADHPNIALCHFNIGNTLIDSGRKEEARAHILKAREIMLKTPEMFSEHLESIEEYLQRPE